VVDTISFYVLTLSSQPTADPFGNLGKLTHKCNNLKAGAGCVGSLNRFEGDYSYDALEHWLNAFSKLGCLQQTKP